MKSSTLLSTALILLGLTGQTFGDDKAVAPLSDVPVMIEQAQSAGIEHTYTGPWEFFVGGGAASFDCNGDRMPDLFLAGGKGESAFYINRSRAGGNPRI